MREHASVPKSLRPFEGEETHLSPDSFPEIPDCYDLLPPALVPALRAQRVAPTPETLCVRSAGGELSLDGVRFALLNF